MVCLRPRPAARTLTRPLRLPFRLSHALLPHCSPAGSACGASGASPTPWRPGRSCATRRGSSATRSSLRRSASSCCWRSGAAAARAAAGSGWRSAPGAAPHGWAKSASVWRTWRIKRRCGGGHPEPLDVKIYWFSMGFGSAEGIWQLFRLTYAAFGPYFDGFGCFLMP